MRRLLDTFAPAVDDVEHAFGQAGDEAKISRQLGSDIDHRQAIEAARLVVFTVAGAEKHDALAGVLARDLALPAARRATAARPPSSRRARRHWPDR